MPSKVAQHWINELASGETQRHEIKTRLQYFWFKLRPCSKQLKQIIHLGKIRPGMKILDFGAGGGCHSVPLAYMGYEVDALDCSDAVLKNLVTYKESVEKYAKKKLRINTIVADILESNLCLDKYDIIFSCGVMEHFVDEKERKKVYKILASSLRKEEDCLITHVPNGKHPFRRRQRLEKLGGYNIEEIDYTLPIFIKDVEETGLVLEKVKGVDLFGYLFILPEVKERGLLRSLMKLLYFFFRLFGDWLPFAFMQKYAYRLLFSARRTR